MDYAFDVTTENVYAGVESGDLSYRDAMKKIHVMGAGAVEGFHDIYQNRPPETRTGSGDPRVPLEMATSLGQAQLAGFAFAATEQ